MRVLVTGADGFVGRWLIRGLVASGVEVLGAVKPGLPPEGAQLFQEFPAVRWLPLDLGNRDAVRAVTAEPVDAVVHLAAVSSGADARKDPTSAWEVNAVGTARLVEEYGRRRTLGESDPLVLVASTGEVYGRAVARPFVESDPIAPCSPYAASKCGAELAARETAARTGLRVIVARPFTQFGPGQDERFLVPALARRLQVARRAGARVVKVGNLDPVRDFLDVRDAAAALLALVNRGEPGMTYNVATGVGVRLRNLFDELAAIVGVDAIPETDPALMRTADIPYLVGDTTRMRAATGWSPAIPRERTLADIVASQ